MRIPRIDQALEKCQSHLSSGTIEVEIESLLTRSLLILIYAEFERAIKNLIKKRCSSIADDSVKNFAVGCTDRVFRGLRIDEMAGLLGQFDKSCKETFTHRLDQKTKDMYNNVLNNRHQVAHGKGSAVTFREVKQYYEHAHVVLDCFRESLFQNVNGSA